MPWIIRSRVERNDESGEPLYWSNEWGWVNRADADHYTKQDRDTYAAHPEKLIGGADWEQVPQLEEVR